MPEESKEQIRARELKTMIEDLTICINEYEKKMLEPGRATNLHTIQNKANREEYAGWVAQRNLFKRLLSDLKPYCNDDDYFYWGIRP